MIPSILLALTVIVVMVDVLVGIHRGFGFSVVRLLIWIAGSFICALFARSFTVWLLMKIANVPERPLHPTPSAGCSRIPLVQSGLT